MSGSEALKGIKTACVIGTGVSGVSAAKLLCRHVERVIIFDQNEKTDIEHVKELLGEYDCDILIGELPEEILSHVNLCVPSPGVFPESDIFRAFKEHDIKIWGEIELAYKFEKGKVVAITGTNGKTTTTTLTGEILKAWNPATFVVGNIGNPYTAEAEKTGEGSFSVAEISSYQLETTETFHPMITAILNITPDHLDRHHTMDEYARVKESICKNQNELDTCVLNYDDDRLREFGEVCPANVVWFGRLRKPPKGLWCSGDHIYLTGDGEERELLNVNDTKLPGTHNYENIMAAFAMATAAGVPEELALDVIKNFKGVEHRIEFVREKGGVKYFNDSKGTNTDAATKAIEAMKGPVILIAGGYDKKAEFDGFLDIFPGRVKEMVLVGETAGKIEETARRHGFTNCVHAGEIEKAVEICARDAEAGDNVLLSPACASWDQFKNFEERGRAFKKAVNAL